MAHAISNLALGVGQSFLCRGEGVGHVFFISHISKCSGPPHPILFDQSLKIQLFYMKKQLSYKHIFCKKAAFLQKYISVKKQSIYIKKQLFSEICFCKKAVFLQPFNFQFFYIKRFKRLLVFVRSIFSQNK